MRAEGWNQERFGELLREIRERAALSDQDLARLAGRSRSQVNRWTRAEHQPTYETLRRLVDNLTASDASLADLGRELLAAAGYEPTPKSGTDAVERKPVSAQSTDPPDDLPPDVVWGRIPPWEWYLWWLPDPACPGQLASIGARRSLIEMARALFAALDPDRRPSSEDGRQRDIG